MKDTLLRFFDRNAQGRQRLARRLQHLFALLKGEGQRRFNAIVLALFNVPATSTRCLNISLAKS